MAVRFDADGEDYTRAIALGSLGAITVSCWVKISVDRNTWSTPWFIDDGVGDNWGIQTSSDGVTMGVVDGGTTLQNMGALTVGAWYFICLVQNGSAGTLYHATGNAASLSTVMISGGTTDVNAATLRIGESPWGSEWLNGCVAAFKFWTAALSAAEVANEWRQYAPIRTANLSSFHPFVVPETTDYSGNARTLSGGTNTAREDGPPIPWRVSSPRLILPVSAGGPQSASASLTVTETVTATAQAEKIAGASPAWTEAVTATARADKSAAASPSITSTITADSSATKSASATLAATAGVTAAASADKPAGAIFGATAAISAAVSAAKPLDAALSVAASASAAASATKSAAASLAATATITADAVVGQPPKLADATLDVAAGRTATAVKSATLDGTLTVTGALAAAASLTRVSDAAISTTVTIAASAAVQRSASATLAVTASLAASAVEGVGVAWPPSAGGPIVDGGRTAGIPTGGLKYSAGVAVVASGYTADPPTVSP